MVVSCTDELMLMMLLFVVSCLVCTVAVCQSFMHAEVGMLYIAPLCAVHIILVINLHLIAIHISASVSLCINRRD